MAWQIPLLCLPQTTFLLDVGDAGRSARHRPKGSRRSPGARWRWCAGASARCRWSSTTARRRCTRRSPTWSTLEPVRRSTSSTSRSGRAAEEAQNLMSVDVSPEGREGGASRRRHRPTPPSTRPTARSSSASCATAIGIHHAGLLPQVPAARRAAGAAGPAQGHQRHRHAGRRRQRPHPHRALHAALQVRRREDRHPRRARLPADCRPRRPQGLRRARLRGRAGARARHREQAPGGQAGGRQEGGDAEAARQGLRPLGSRDLRPAGRTGTPEPLDSRFEVTHGMLLNCLQSRAPRRAATGGWSSIIGRSHGGPRDKRAERRRAAAYFRTLRARAASSTSCPPRAVRGRVVEVSAELQRDFSLNQTLSLYLLEALGVLDRAVARLRARRADAGRGDPSRTRDAVLRKQLDQLKTEKMAEMKAAGVEYEERIAELETLEWPKPNRDFIYATFNDFAERHPWVGQDNVRPKSIAREMFEGSRPSTTTCATRPRAQRGGAAALPVAGLQDARADRPRRRRAPTRCSTCSPICDRCCATSTRACSTSGRRSPIRAPAGQGRRAGRGRAVDPAAERRATVAAIRAELHKLVARAGPARLPRRGAPLRAGRRRGRALDAPSG